MSFDGKKRTGLLHALDLFTAVPEVGGYGLNADAFGTHA